MNAIATLLFMVPFFVPIWLSNVGLRERSVRAINIIYLVLLNGGIALIGLSAISLGALLNSNDFANSLQQQNVGINVAQLRAARLDLAGFVLITFSILALVMLIPTVRQFAVRILPMQADNPVHATALSLTATAVGLNLFQMLALSPLLFAAVSTQEGAQQLEQAGGASYLDVLAYPLLTFVIAALLGVGLYIRRNQAETLERLGLTFPSVRQLGLSVLVTAGLLALSFATQEVWRTVDPKSFEAVGGLSKVLLGDLTGLAGAFAIGAAAAIGEETFFRGAYQPRIGLVLSSLVFASFHVQYGITMATLLVLVFGFVLGVLRQRTSLTVCIIVHFLYNFTSVLLP